MPLRIDCSETAMSRLVTPAPRAVLGNGEGRHLQHVAPALSLEAEVHLGRHAGQDLRFVAIEAHLRMR